MTLAATAKPTSFSIPPRWGKKKKGLGPSLLLPLLLLLMLVLGTKTNTILTTTSSVFRLAVEHGAHRLGQSSHTREAHLLETPSPSTTTASAAFPALSSQIHVSVCFLKKIMNMYMYMYVSVCFI